MGRTCGHAGRVERLEPRRLLAAAAGDPDPSFGDAGYLAASSAGPVVAVDGGNAFLQFTNHQTIEKRDAATGALVPSFGGGDGIVTVPFGGTVAVVPQPDGKILALGDTDATTPAEDPGVTSFLARLNADGSPDTSFGAGGTVNLKQALDVSFAQSLAVQSSGKIVLFAYTAAGDDELLRLNADGTRDAGFAIAFGDGGNVAPVVVQGDDKILFASDTDTFAGHPFSVARFNADGTLDTSFATGGFVPPIASDVNAGDPVQPSSVLPLPGGGFLLSAEGKVRKYDASGKLDASFATAFNTSNVMQLGFNPAVGTLLAPAPGGKFILYDRSNIARLNADGSLDESFGRLVVGSGPMEFQGLAVTAGGDLMVPTSLQNGKSAELIELLGAADAAAPAASVSLSAGGVLSVTGTDEAEEIHVEQVTESHLTDFETPATGDTIAQISGKVGRLYHQADVKMVSVLAGGGNDFVVAAPEVAPVTVSGGDGDDTLSGGDEADSLSGNAGRDTITGGGGNDRVAGNGGGDTLYGDEGDDRLFGGAGRDILVGGSGHDTLAGGRGNDRLVASYGGGSFLHGNSGDDVFACQNFSGEGAADTVSGDFGHDTAVADDIDRLIGIEVRPAG